MSHDINLALLIHSFSLIASLVLPLVASPPPLPRIPTGTLISRPHLRRNMHTATLALAATLLFLLAAPAAGECAQLHEQCGGKNHAGPTCCAQPTPLPPYVNSIPQDSNICVTVNAYYSSCQRRCSRAEPCLVQNSRCEAAVLGDTDGHGRQYCGQMSGCTNPDWCYSDPISCVCGGSVPCALTSRPGGCRTKRPDPAAPNLGVCGPGLRRCPAFEGEQCGGTGHIEPTTCQPGLSCVKYSNSYSGCARS